MNDKKSGNCVMKVLSTPCRLAVAAVIPLLCASSVSMARDGALSFHGSVVNPSCEVSLSLPVDKAQAVHSLQVAPGVKIQVDSAKNACAQGSVPFVAHYQEISYLPAEQVSVKQSGTARAAIVTLTYQ